MNYKNYASYSVEDFILDKNFVKWVLHPTVETDIFWREFIGVYPEKEEQILEAIFLVKSLQTVEPSIPQHRLDQIYKTARSNALPSHKPFFLTIKVAAILFFIVSLGFTVYLLQNNQDNFNLEIAEIQDNEHGKIILPDGTVNEFNTKQTNIGQTSSGNLTINNDTIILKKRIKEETKHSLARVIIPHGKRSEIELSDGTKIWLNSGSQLQYPVEFTEKSREVFLSGEAFFDVKKDPSKPFYVTTNNLKIKVTGTRFNVMAYSDDNRTEAVLQSGKIEASKNKILSKTIKLESGEMISFNIDENKIEKRKVDTEFYSSWINGYLIFKNEPITNIFTKLERYYNREIVYEGFVNNISFTGKLNLDEDIETALNILRFSAPFNVSNQGETIKIKLNN